MKDLNRSVKWFSHKGSISQVYSTGLEYAFCTPDYEQHLPWVFCKDFLHDAVFSFLHGTKLDIYGYSYDPKSSPGPDLRHMRLLVANNSDAQFGDKIDNALNFVNQVEKAMNFSFYSRAFRCPEPPAKYKRCGIYLFEGSGHWMLSPPLISLYTLLVRAGFAHVAGTPYAETMDKITTGKVPGYQTNDASQLGRARVGIDRLVVEGYREVFTREMKPNYPIGVPIGTMHHNFGIVAFSTGVTKTLSPQWHKVA